MVFPSADAGQSIAGIPISFAAHLIDYVLKLRESKKVVKGAAVSVVKTIWTFEGIVTLSALTSIVSSV